MKLLLSLCCCTFALHAGMSDFFAWHRGAREYTHEQFADAQRDFEAVVTASPDDAAALYNAGKAAYKQQQFERAQAYFEDARQQHAAQQLHKQIVYDLGNAYAQQKKV